MNRAIAATLPRLAAGLTAAIGFSSLMGWAVNSGTLKSVFPREAPLEANAALALLLAAVALFRLSSSLAKPARDAQVMAFVVLAIGLATLAQYVFDIDFRIDELLFQDVSDLPGTAPGRMSPYSAVAFIGIGVALAVYPAHSLRPLVWAAAALAGCIGAVPVAGYLVGAPGVLGNRWVSPFAATIAFVLLSVGTLVASAAAGDRTARPAARSSVEKKVMAAFAGALLLLFLGAGFTYRASVDFTESLQGISRTEQLRDSLTNLSLALAGAEAAQTAYLLTSRHPQREEYERLAGTARAYQKAIAGSVAQEPAQASDLADLNDYVDLRLALLAVVTTLFDENGLSSAREAVASDEGVRTMRSIREITARMDERGERLLLQREATLARSRQLTLGSLLLTLAFAAGIFLTLFRGISREMEARAATERALRERNTEVVKLNTALARRAAEIDAANQELESFSYSVSHDLRVPLRHIDGYLEMLLDQNGKELSDDARKKFDVITDSSRRMGKLIDDLLAFSRMGRTELHSDRVDLDRLVREVIGDLEMATRGRNIDWQIEPLPAVTGDVAMLRQVFSNLISNAVKYTNRRAVAQIGIGQKGEEAGKVVLFVRDNGVGFDMEYASKLFGIFQRLHRAQEFEGTGIGLANVQRILTRHGGRVWAEAEPDRGATFYFTLEPQSG